MLSDQLSSKDQTQGAQGALVLGCGRSGTSAITRCLVLAGFFAGGADEILGASPANPTGHYEPLPVLQLNESLLEEFGSAWWAEAPIERATPLQREQARRKVSKVVGKLIESSDGAPIVIKEPRINGLLDLWGPVTDGVLHPVLVVRNPIEVAFSLSNRDGSSIAHSLAAWEVQTNGALRWAQGKLVTVVHYAELTRAPKAATEFSHDVRSRLEPGRAAKVDPSRAATALDPGLRNEVGREIDLSEYLTGRQRELWEFLSGLSPGSQVLQTPDRLRPESRAALLATRSEGDRKRLLDERAQLLEERHRLLEDRHGLLEERHHLLEDVSRLSARGAELSEQGDVFAAERDAAVERTAEVAAEVEQARREIAKLGADLSAVSGSFSWRMTRPLRTLKALFARRFG